MTTAINLQAEQELVSLSRRDMVRAQNEASALYREAVAYLNSGMPRFTVSARIQHAKSALKWARECRQSMNYSKAIIEHYGG